LRATNACLRWAEKETAVTPESYRPFQSLARVIRPGLLRLPELGRLRMRTPFLGVIGLGVLPLSAVPRRLLIA
jgi:hypothetical protein